MSRRRSGGGEKRKKDYRNAVCLSSDESTSKVQSMNDSWVPFLFSPRRKRQQRGCLAARKWKARCERDGVSERYWMQAFADFLPRERTTPFDPVVSAPITSRIQNVTSCNVTASLGIILFESPRTRTAPLSLVRICFPPPIHGYGSWTRDRLL